MNLILLIGLQIVLQVLGYVIMGVGLRLGWTLGEKLMRGLAWANKKLK